MTCPLNLVALELVLDVGGEEPVGIRRPHQLVHLFLLYVRAEHILRRPSLKDDQHVSAAPAYAVQVVSAADGLEVEFHACSSNSMSLSAKEM